MYLIDRIILLNLVVVLLINVVLTENKYSRDANVNKQKEADFRSLDKPFRMAKLNILWLKAQQVLTLLLFYYIIL